MHGPAGQGDELAPTTIVPMTPMGQPDPHAQSVRYEGSFTCAQTGRYGFTVRVVPAHPLLVNAVELGRIAWA